MIKKSFFTNCVLAICLACWSCHFNPPGPGKYSKFLQGCWNQDTSLTLVDTSLYLRRVTSFSFKLDSVYMRIHTVAKQNYMGNSCFKKGSITEFAKGTYQFKHDSLLISGVYTHPNYKMKVAGCYRSGYLIYLYKIEDSSAQSLEFRNTQEHERIHLIKVNGSSCVHQ